MNDQTTAADERAAGMGGSYMVNPETGETTLEHRTQDPTTESPAPASAGDGEQPAA